MRPARAAAPLGMTGTLQLRWIQLHPFIHASSFNPGSESRKPTRGFSVSQPLCTGCRDKPAKPQPHTLQSTTESGPGPGHMRITPGLSVAGIRGKTHHTSIQALASPLQHSLQISRRTRTQPRITAADVSFNDCRVNSVVEPDCAQS